MKALLVSLAMLVATSANALNVCPDGEFLPTLPVTVTGNTCGEQFTGDGVGNAFTPINYAGRSNAPEHGYLALIQGPYRVRFNSAFPFAIAQVMDVQTGDCLHGPYGFVTQAKPASNSGINSGYPDEPRLFGIFIDSQYRTCGPYSLTIEPVTP
jgi:hypothetical protein